MKKLEKLGYDKSYGKSVCYLEMGECRIITKREEHKSVFHK